MKGWFLLLAMLLLVTACTRGTAPTIPPGDISPDTAVTKPAQADLSTQGPIANPFVPQPEDTKLTRGTVFTAEAGLVIRESYPPQISLNISGDLPTPCHQLRVQVNDPDADNKINVDVYTIVDPDLMCTQVLEPFNESIAIGTFSAGHYSVWVNGESVGEFDS